VRNGLVKPKPSSPASGGRDNGTHHAEGQDANLPGLRGNSDVEWWRAIPTPAKTPPLDFNRKGESSTGADPEGMSDRWWWYCGDWLIPKFFPFVAFRTGRWRFTVRLRNRPGFKPQFLRYLHPVLWGQVCLWRVLFGIQRPSWDWWEMTREILSLTPEQRVIEAGP
jgi:hypothetical protein